MCFRIRRYRRLTAGRACLNGLSVLIRLNSLGCAEKILPDISGLPVRLDLFLSFGSAKCYLTGYKGLRNPMDSKVE